MSNHKNPPSFKKGDNYENWKKTLGIWQLVTSLEKSKQGPAIFLSLDSEAQEAILELPQDQIACSEGVKNILTKLDNLYKKDKTQSAFEALEDFEGLKRTEGQSIKDFCNQFDLAYNKAKTYGTTLSTDVLAFRLMKSANLKEDQEDLVKATIGELNFDNMKAHLKKIHVHVGVESDDFKQENSFLVEEDFYEEEEQTEDIFYTQGPKPNVPDEFGNPTTCGCCQSIYHYIKDCPHALRRQRGGHTRPSRGYTGQSFNRGYVGAPTGQAYTRGNTGATSSQSYRGRLVSRRPYNYRL